MSADDNRKRIRELRWIGFQRLLAGVVLLFASGVLCFVLFGVDANSHSHSGIPGLLLLVPVYGLWSIVRGIIYFIRAQSGDEGYAKAVEDVMDKYERKLDDRMRQRPGNASMQNVLILLVWVFLFLFIVGGIWMGYLIWTRPR